MTDPAAKRGFSLSADRQDDPKEKFVYISRIGAANSFKYLITLNFPL